jgi:HEAT repeat protein
MPRFLRAMVAAVALGASNGLSTVAQAAEGLPPLADAQWIWASESADVCEVRRTFTLDALPSRATALITADNSYLLRVNGAPIGEDQGSGSEVWQSVERYDLTGRLVRGRNVLHVRGIDLGGIRGVVAALRVEFEDRPALDLLTDASWRACPEVSAVDASHPEFVEGPTWTSARVVGPMGVPPWGALAWSEEAERRERVPRPGIVVVEPDATFEWPDAVVFLGDDCSVYVPTRADAWGVAFRIGDWTRAYTEFDLPCPSKIGRKLYLLKPGPGAKPRSLLDAGTGVIGSPDMSFDGQSVLVAMARAGDSFFHIYRVPLDGSEFRQLTDGPFHDIDPAELPDGQIVFTSTRIGTFEEYHQPPSRALFRMNADGTGIHPITSTLIFDNEPEVIADGRIAFVRTDNFFDRGKVETHLHVIRPDGSDGHAEVAANVGADYGARLRAFGYGSPAPLPDGQLAFISSHGNFIAAPGAKPADFHRLPAPVGDLAALPDGRLLATVLRYAGRQMSSDVLAVIDPHDNRVTGIFRSDTGAIHSPVFAGPRAPPARIPDFIDPRGAEAPGATGFLLCQDARLTTKTAAGWNRVRAIRVLGAVPLTVRSSHSHIVHVGHETVELGTVPLAEDGSFFVEVPADVPLALQAVDAEDRSELNEMSWLYVRPGERRACIGCHQPRESTPAFASARPLALRTPPLKTLGQGDPHRFRGNNPGVTGMMDLQFERFRECASLNRSVVRDLAEARGADDLEACIAALRDPQPGPRVSAAQRLGMLRDPSAAPALVAALQDSHREVRIAATLGLATCGRRDSVPPLISLLADPDPLIAQAATLAVENLTGHFRTPPDWQDWLKRTDWNELELALTLVLRPGTPASERTVAKAVRRSGAPIPDLRSAIVALGHIGGDLARQALREWLNTESMKEVYPVFENDNRTDTFTYGADSPFNPRTLQEAARALGSLRDTESLPLLRRLLETNLDARTGNLFLAEAVAEALGRIGSPEAERILINTFSRLPDYWHHVGWYSDHPALYACHSGPVHARVIDALNRIGSRAAGPEVPQLIRSVPTDPDRALFPQNDDYELQVGRLIRRGGRGSEVVSTCLALLGDPEAIALPDVRAALSTTHPAWAGHPGPENRAAQILSLACRDAAFEPRARAAFERYLMRPEEPVQRALGNPTWTPIRHWVLFYLARTLGNLQQEASVDILMSVLRDDLNEARHGRPDPSTPEIHFLHLEYTPCWRAAAAWALGEIGHPRAVPALIRVVRNLENAVDVRHTAAGALAKVATSTVLPELESLAAGYPEVSTRRALQATCDTLRRGATGRRLAGSPNPP